MRLRAADGLQCPMENKPKEYITDDAKGVEVDDSTYYRRLVDDGSLVIVPPEKAKASAIKGGDQQ